MKKVTPLNPKPTREEAEAAVKTLISWAGDNPNREGLIETPKRVVKSYEEFYSGYDQDPEEILSKVFEEVEGYDEIIIVKDIRLESHCEHHMVPILGKAHVAYIPDQRVVGISKLARVVDLYRETTSNSRNNDGSNSRYDRQSAQAQGRCNCYRCCPSMHEQSRGT